MRKLPLSRFLCSLVLLMIPSTPSLRAEIQVELAEPPIPIPPVKPGGEDSEVSAIEALGPDLFLLGADEEKSLLIADLEGRSVEIEKQLSPGSFSKKPKWEALAKDEKGFFYVVGSHNVNPDDPEAIEKLEARSNLVRFSIDGEVSRPGELTLKSPVILDLKDALDREGLYKAGNPGATRAKIEGLTVRAVPIPGGASRQELVVGLREPFECSEGEPPSAVSCIRAYAADLSNVPGQPTDVAPIPLDLKLLFTFGAEAREGVPAKLSSLVHSPEWGGFLVLTSTEDGSNKFHGNTLWFLPDSEAKGKEMGKAQKLWVFGLVPGGGLAPEAKAEGLAILPGKQETEKPDRLRLVIAYDNDSVPEGGSHKPSFLQLVTLVRWPD